MSPTDAQRTALVTLGRLPVALESARALRANGWRVLVADPLPLHLCRFSRHVDGHRRVRPAARDPDGFLEDVATLVERDRVSLIVPVSEESPHVARLHGRTAAAVLGPTLERLLTLHDKLAFARFADGLGVGVPESVASSEASALCHAHDWVEKPRLSASGLGVVFGAAGEACSGRADRLVQRRLRGRALCSFSFAAAGRVLGTAVYRSLLDAGSVSVCFESVAVPDDVRRTIDVIVEATAYTGMIGFDFLHDGAAGWLAIECNPRATSGIHLFAPGRAAAAFNAMVNGANDRFDVSPGVRRQEFWSSLIEVEGALLLGRIDRPAWRRLFGTRDVTWRADDPLPFPMMTVASLPLLWRALRARRPITEVATTDIGWYRDGR